ncbi:hypothetical protein MUK42_13425 [Musa troglodytarum]|uniref:Uncharacterized protein n=1 Tax=Musa troglodytarum TaxID=320322 RepID=A0A9E7L124_9LILI|nr:hypothetical protein MUK42_13425 [Musa troglodytarum]
MCACVYLHAQSRDQKLITMTKIWRRHQSVASVLRMDCDSEIDGASILTRNAAPPSLLKCDCSYCVCTNETIGKELGSFK